MTASGRTTCIIRGCTTSSLMIMRSFSTATRPMASNSSFENIFPRGLWGVLRTIIFVREVHFDSSSAMSRVHSDAEWVCFAVGGRIGTYTILPPFISMLEMY